MDYRRKTATVGGLFLLTCLVQAWTIGRAVLPAQDSVRYLIVAQGIERDGLAATMRSQPEQPLFPALAWLTHRSLCGANLVGRDNWAICLQLAAAIPLVLSVIPVHALFCRLHGECAAAVGASLYCLLGGIARLGADGLSDSTHLALFCTALWAAARYYTPQCRGSAGWLFLTGCTTGMALVARSEAIVVPIAVLATLAWLQIFRDRASWSATARAAAGLLIGLAVVLVPYLALSESYRASAAVARLTGRQGAAEAAPLNDFEAGVHPASVEPRWDLPGTGRLIFGKKDTSTSTRFRGYLAPLAKLLEELAQTLHYWLGATALVGLWTARRELTSPLDRFMQCLCATLVVAAICVASQSGYLSTRHVLLLVVLGVGWAGVGALALGEWLSTLIAQCFSFGGLRGAVGSLVTLSAVAACGADCLPTLHASRRAHRDAAQWLVNHARPTEAVLDSRGFTALYTGRKTYRYEAAQAAFADPALTYVVVERQELSTNSRRSETMRLLMAQAGEPVARFGTAESEKHCVIVHRWRPERFQQL
ncbi:MAG TPA: glycosyltransferase family 39 protein, partial [Pirellulales bacterium]|nr:glycosyltransferase family 39 protein [Pirellulales bacterium]